MGQTTENVTCDRSDHDHESLEAARECAAREIANPFMNEGSARLQEDLRLARANLTVAREGRRHAPRQEQPFIDDDIAYWKATIAQIGEALEAKAAR